MSHKRNVEGLRQNAQKKRQEAVTRTEQGIRQLLQEGRTVNFKAVSEIADVSTAWLYKELDIKKHIESLRNRESDGKKSSMEKSNQLELENECLLKQTKTIKELTSKILKLEDELLLVKRENKELRAQLAQHRFQ
jgi:hypothetical protein